MIPRLLCLFPFLLLAAAPTRAQQTLQLPEDGVVVRALPADAAPARVCAPGARWLRLGFAELTLRGEDRLVLASDGGDRLALAGPQWEGRRFYVRALRGACVSLAADFHDAASRYRLSGYQAGAQPLQATTVTVAGAGDLCSDITPGDCVKTSDLVIAINPTVALAIGDNAYASGTLAEYTSNYDPAWGRFKALTAPVPGNHEYLTTGASGYFDYFNGAGVQTGPAGDRSEGWYSYDVGDWHFIALNSKSGGTVSSAQLAWLDADLHADTKPCTAAYFHHPFISRGRYNGYATLKPVFDRLYASRADLALVGHDHDYQRWAPMDGNQVAQADGVREVIVGTGGAELSPVTRTHPLLQASQGDTFGVLRLDLTTTGYNASFVPIAGKTWTDSFSGSCHRAQGVVGDFLLSGTTGISIPRGSSGGKLITVTSYGGFNAPVTLSLSGLPAGVTGTFSANPVTPPPDGSITSRLVLRVASTATTGTFALTVSGTDGKFVRTFAIKLIVK
ncbi:MAG: alkaline phosphatase [Lysobacter sp.]|nr:alkaline phosphatase [Lysobacter sp.]